MYNHYVLIPHAGRVADGASFFNFVSEWAGLYMFGGIGSICMLVVWRVAMYVQSVKGRVLSTAWATHFSTASCM